MDFYILKKSFVTYYHLKSFKNYKSRFRSLWLVINRFFVIYDCGRAGNIVNDNQFENSPYPVIVIEGKCLKKCYWGKINKKMLKVEKPI